KSRTLLTYFSRTSSNVSDVSASNSTVSFSLLPRTNWIGGDSRPGIAISEKLFDFCNWYSVGLKRKSITLGVTTGDSIINFALCRFCAALLTGVLMICCPHTDRPAIFHRLHGARVLSLRPVCCSTGGCTFRTDDRRWRRHHRPQHQTSHPDG